MLERLEVEHDGRVCAAVFAELRPFLVGEDAGETYAQTADRLQTTTAALKMTVSRLRRRCRELLREEIARTVTTPALAEEEYRALLAAVRG